MLAMSGLISSGSEATSDPTLSDPMWPILDPALLDPVVPMLDLTMSDSAPFPIESDFTDIGLIGFRTGLGPMMPDPTPQVLGPKRLDPT